MVFNETLLSIIKSCDAGKIDMHDSFTHAMCLASGGRVIKDKTVYVHYRLHEAQVLGAGDFSFSENVRRFLHPGRLRSKTVATMLTSKRITGENRKYLNRFAHYKNPINKIKLLASPRPAGLTKNQHRKFIIQVLTNTY